VQILHRRIPFQDSVNGLGSTSTAQAFASSQVRSSAQSVASPLLKPHSVMKRTGTQMTSISIRRADKGDVQVVSVSGYWGNDEFHRLDEELERLSYEKCRGVILDCASLTFITSLTLARLLLVTQLLRRQGCEVRLAGLSPSAGKMAKALGFDSNLELQPDVAAAVNSMPEEAASRPKSSKRRKFVNPLAASRRFSRPATGTTASGRRGGKVFDEGRPLPTDGTQSTRP
jgi:anti-anti-sigma factor